MYFLLEKVEFSIAMLVYRSVDCRLPQQNHHTSQMLHVMDWNIYPYICGLNLVSREGNNLHLTNHKNAGSKKHHCLYPKKTIVWYIYLHENHKNQLNI